MNVELSPESQAAIEILLRNGWYTSTEQIVDIAVANLLEAEPNNARLRILVQQGIDSARNEPLVTEEQLLQHLAERRLKRA